MNTNCSTKSESGDSRNITRICYIPPISWFELAGELGPLLLVFPLQVAYREWDALLAVWSQTSAL